MLSKELMSINDSLLSGWGEKGGMRMIGLEIVVREGAVEMKCKATWPNFVPFDVRKVKAFASVGIHLLQLGVLGGKKALLGAYRRGFNWSSVRLKLMFKRSIRV
jgi:hypothetical protein